MPEQTTDTERTFQFCLKLPLKLVREIDTVSRQEMRSRAGTVHLAILAFLEQRKATAQERKPGE